VKCTPEMKKYFEELEKGCSEAYSVASAARSKLLDPSNQVEVKLAKTLSERVIGLISVVAPQLSESDAPKRIRELEEEYGILDWRVAFKIAEEVALERFCKFKDKKEAIETGIRVGFAYVTLGVVSAPIEGFTGLEIKKTLNGEEYFCLNYAGPIRNAGGTAAALSVIIGDYLRKKFGYAAYDPTDKEIQRCHAELSDYHEKVTNLQYFPSKEECEFMMKNLPVEISGDPSEKYEISNFNLKDLPRVNTNYLRSGYCLIHSSCLSLKAPKLWAALQKWGGDFGLGHWSFLEEFIKIQKKKKAKGKERGGELAPDYTFIKDLVAGRPVLSHALRSGGFRIRYGRARNSGYSAQAIHPATMRVLKGFVATGTQLKVERPGKAAAITVCDSIEGPVVKLRDGSVKILDSEEEATRLINEVDEILFLGDVLINYGDFYDRAHPLVPVGYCEEWWLLELERVGGYVEDPYKVSFEEAVRLSEEFKVPLHPRFTYHWQSLTVEELKRLKSYASSLKGGELPLSAEKRFLELIGCPHSVEEGKVLLEHPWRDALTLQLGISKRKENFGGEGSVKTSLELVNEWCPFTVRDKSGTFMGARMGRPEKAKMRKMKGSPHCLFPVGSQGGKYRSVLAALEKGFVRADFKTYYCERCRKETPLYRCPECGGSVKEAAACDKCGLVEDCPHHPSKFKTYELDMKKYFNHCLKLLNTNIYPDIIKGVRGTSSREHHAEHLVKGILRAKHRLNVNKDGTIRYDISETPLTHFKPKEVGVSVSKLRRLGYTKDVHGNPLRNEDQVLELKPQDIVIPCCPDSPDESCDEVLFKATKFIDELLETLYGEKPFYNLKRKEELAGVLVVGLAPHTSAGMLGRVIGFSKTQGFLAHPLFHAAMRRDCDGDESCVLLLMDAFLNFSRKYLPDSRGSTMDAPLVLTTLLNPAEVDDMAFKMDIEDRYPLELYQAAQESKMPWEVEVKQLKDVLGTEKQFQGLMYTHETSDLNKGVLCSAYKTLPSMKDKLRGQMDLALRIRAVDQRDVARLVIEKHFIRDAKGNLRKFSQQQFRCVDCNEKYRRPPLRGVCSCGGRLIFTVSEGFVKKYLEPSLQLAEMYGADPYLKQTLELLKASVEEVFGRDAEKQEALEKWF